MNLAVFLTLGMAFWLTIAVGLALAIGAVISTADEQEQTADTDETDRFEAWA